MLVADRLATLGAVLSGSDPHVPSTLQGSLPFELVHFDIAALERCDLAILLVDHPEFDPAVISKHAPLVFDTKGVLRAHEFRGETL